MTQTPHMAQTETQPTQAQSLHPSTITSTKMDGATMHTGRDSTSYPTMTRSSSV